jgi:hypothetical protein
LWTQATEFLFIKIIRVEVGVKMWICRALIVASSAPSSFSQAENFCGPEKKLAPLEGVCSIQIFSDRQ